MAKKLLQSADLGAQVVSATVWRSDETRGKFLTGQGLEVEEAFESSRKKSGANNSSGLQNQVSKS